MDKWLASFFVGAILSLFLPVVPDFFLLILLILLAISLFLFKSFRLCSGFLIGGCWLLFSVNSFDQLWQANGLVVKDIVHQRHVVQGEILTLQMMAVNNPNIKALASTIQRVRFTLKVTQLDSQVLTRAINMRLSWKSPRLTLQQGQKIQLSVKFKPSHGLSNLGGFNYKTWLNSKQISATGYVVPSIQNIIIGQKPSLRQQLFNHYTHLLPPHRLSALLLAIGFGDRSLLNSDENKELWQVLQATGTGHLIAISGLHIGLVATGSYYVALLLIRLLPIRLSSFGQTLQRSNIIYTAVMISLLSACVYGYLAGFSLPTVRALIMLNIYWLIRFLAIKITVKRWLLLTLFIITLSSPFSLLSVSFWLSVYAVTVIFVTLWRFKYIIGKGAKWWRFIKGLLLIQCCLTIMLWPLAALFFQQISAVSLFANIVAVPWMSFITIPLCLLSVVISLFSEVFATQIIIFCLSSLAWLWDYLHWLSTHSWAIYPLSSRTSHYLIATVITVSFLLYCFKIPLLKRDWVSMAVIALVLLVLPLLSVNQWSLQAKNVPQRVNANKDNMGKVISHNEDVSTKVNNENIANIDWQLVVFDVGQGLAILLQKQGRAILYDTGASYGSGFNMVDAVILPYLQNQGIAQLDTVIISHSDNDHAGGLLRLQQKIDINQLIFNVDTSLNQQSCQQGQLLSWQHITLQMLSPKSKQGKDNDDSCVVYISDGKNTVLLTGDISKKVEQTLIQQYPTLITDVLIVPHHGSKTSSSAEFIRHLQPKLALVSAGFYNRWQMPVPVVVNRYQQQQVELLTTADVGQIVINFSKTGFIIKNYQQHLRPFWFAN